MLRLAGCIIKDSRGRVLLLHRDDGRYSHWEVPGGKIEPGETPESAAAREIKEELGVEVDVGQKIGEKDFTDRGTRLNYIWYSAKISGKPKVAEPKIFDDLGYFSTARMRGMSGDLSLGAQSYLGIIND